MSDYIFHYILINLLFIIFIYFSLNHLIFKLVDIYFYKVIEIKYYYYFKIYKSY